MFSNSRSFWSIYYSNRFSFLITLTKFLCSVLLFFSCIVIRSTFVLLITLCFIINNYVDCIFTILVRFEILFLLLSIPLTKEAWNIFGSEKNWVLFILFERINTLTHRNICQCNKRRILYNVLSFQLSHLDKLKVL